MVLTWFNQSQIVDKRAVISVRNEGAFYWGGAGGEGGELMKVGAKKQVFICLGMGIYSTSYSIIC